eukprot:TRINITY_DN1948_c0_g2_i1.p1 TRINITY_DN1948_c0_g2~~TRINITY_DN1948_c0_g2_i1.p1  ORF type:complete len:178 (-),score=47.95 TRINITY_DN1948_c0_g2_i1:154-612(-)
MDLTTDSGSNNNKATLNLAAASVFANRRDSPRPNPRNASPASNRAPGQSNADKLKAGISIVVSYAKQVLQAGQADSLVIALTKFVKACEGVVRMMRALGDSAVESQTKKLLQSLKVLSARPQTELMAARGSTNTIVKEILRLISVAGHNLSN